MRVLVLPSLFVLACQTQAPESPPPPVQAVKDTGPQWAQLIVKAGDGQRVRTKDGFWLKANAGDTHANAILVQSGPAAAAERAFVRSFVETPPCALGLSFESAGLDTQHGWHDKLIVRCGESWQGRLYFDLSEIIARQTDQLKLIDERERPEAMGLDKLDLKSTESGTTSPSR
ncbi:MAG: hypothetical protein CMH55_05815 [Myxococcales bacterium]|nr:hypothetical protein [Myxococcales bacterium]